MKTLALSNRSASQLAICQSARNSRTKPRTYTSVRVNCKLSTSSPDVVVIGGGIAGLLAASVFSKQVDKVVLVEKDNIYGSVANLERLKTQAASETEKQALLWDYFIFADRSETPWCSSYRSATSACSGSCASFGQIAS